MRLEELLTRTGGRDSAVVLQVARAYRSDRMSAGPSDPMAGLMATARRLQGSSTSEVCS